MLFGQVTIVGVGLLGGSLGLALRQAKLAGEVVGVGHRESTLQQARERGAVDRYSTSIPDGVRGADLVVLATPVGLFRQCLELAGPALAPGCLVTDVGSTKRRVIEEALPLVPEGCAFVGSHPLAGSEARGIEAATVDLYKNALVLVTPTARSDEAAVQRVEALWQALGSRTRRVDPQIHDHLLAETSHLPHLIAATLIESLGPESYDFVGKGFLDTTRIASGDPVLWRDIFMTNRDEVLGALEQFASALDNMRRALASADAETLEGFLREAKSKRDQLLNSRRNGYNSGS